MAEYGKWAFIALAVWLLWVGVMGLLLQISWSTYLTLMDLDLWINPILALATGVLFILKFTEEK